METPLTAGTAPDTVTVNVSESASSVRALPSRAGDWMVDVERVGGRRHPHLRRAGEDAGRRIEGQATGQRRRHRQRVGAESRRRTRRRQREASLRAAREGVGRPRHAVEGRPLARHPVVGLVAQRVAAEAEGGGHAPRLDAAAIERQRVRGDGDAVAVPVAPHDRVAEVDGGARRRPEGRLARARAHGQRQPRRPGDRHRLAEGDRHVDVAAPGRRASTRSDSSSSGSDAT